MKKIFSMMLIFIMVLSMAACGGKKTAEEVGSYRMIEMSSGDEVLDAETLDAYSEMMGEDMRDMFTLEMKEDGTVTLIVYDEELSGTYSNGVIKTSEGDVPYTYADGKITIEIDTEKVVFEKQTAK